MIEGRSFRTEMDYARASRDKAVIDKLREEMKDYDVSQLTRLKQEVQSGKYHFQTILGQDFEEELDERIRKVKEADASRLDTYAQKVLLGQEKRRKWIALFCAVVAVGCLGYFAVYSYYDYRTQSNYEQLAELKEKSKGE